jgi:hypothetical protein
MDRYAVDAVLVNALRPGLIYSVTHRVGIAYMWRAKYSAVPVRHQQIVSIVKTIRACLCLLLATGYRMVWSMSVHTSTKTFFAFLQLLQQAEVSRDFGAHDRGSDARGLNGSVTREVE